MQCKMACPLWAISGHLGLFDHLVGTREQRGRYGEAERLGSSEIENELELGRLLHGQIARFGSFENLIYVGRGALC